MEKMTITETYGSPARSAAVGALAVVGFIALVFAGIMLAIYAARYVPSALSEIATSSGYLWAGGGSDQLTVVPTTTLPFPAMATSTATSTKPAAFPIATTTTPAAPATSVVAQPVQYRTVITDYPTPGSTQIPSNSETLSGLPNLVTTVTAVGYLDDNNNFVADKSVSHNDRVAVEFRVTNTGTNVTGTWNLQVTMPTRDSSSFEYDSDPQHSLNPGGYNDYVVSLNAGHARIDNDDQIIIFADSGKVVTESNENDNTATADIDVN